MHWKFSLNSLLTWQFRYLAFHGPCRLILQGCRGIKIEKAEGKLLDQNLTIGFSANIKYSVQRCETFLSYLFGKETLFNDVFDGNGYYIYEEFGEKRSQNRMGWSLGCFSEGLGL